MLSAVSGTESLKEEALTHLLSYIARSEEYRDTWESSVRANAIPLPSIDGVTTKAIQSMANLNVNQMRQIRSCLKVELGSPLFASPFQISQVVNIEYVQPRIGRYKFGSEQIPWPYKSIHDVLELWLKSRYEQDPERTAHWKQVDVCVNLVHGKGHSRLSANFIARWRTEDNGAWQEESFPCALGNARCRKDNAEIIRQTFGRYLNDDLRKISEGGVLEIGGNSVPVELFLAADIMLYAIALGKEGSAGWWCVYCQLFKNHWQNQDHPIGEPWSIESLSAHAEQVEERRGLTSVHDKKG